MAAEETTTDVFVVLGETNVHAGRLWTRQRAGRASATFAYADEYLRHPDAYALDPVLGLASGQQQPPVGRAMFGAFADTAPDRWGRQLLRSAEKQRAGTSGTARTLTEADYLLGVSDELRQGALRFRDPETGRFLTDDGRGVPALIDLPRLLEAAENEERDAASAEDIEALLRGGSSPGGARPKSHVRKNDGRMAIAKFPSPERDSWDVMRWEAVTLDLARRAGIEVADWSLERIADRPVLIVDRFDRGSRSCIGYVSAMTMLELDDGMRGDYLDIVDVLERESPRATADINELWRRVAFSILVSNTDDHPRNHGFLRATTAGWQLAPAFDLNPDPDPGTKFLSTAVAGQQRADIAALLGVAELFRLPDEAARGVLIEVANAVGGWRTAAQEVGLEARAIEAMAPAFEHSQSVEARALAGLTALS